MIEKLKNFRKNRKEINILKELIKDIENDLLSCKISNLSHTPKSTKKSYFLENLIDDKNTLIEQYYDVCNTLYSEQAEIERMIENRPQNERILLRCYYIKGMTWEQTAEFMNLSTMQVWRIHKRVIECYIE